MASVYAARGLFEHKLAKSVSIPQSSLSSILCACINIFVSNIGSLVVGFVDIVLFMTSHVAKFLSDPFTYLNKFVYWVQNSYLKFESEIQI